MLFISNSSTGEGALVPTGDDPAPGDGPASYDVDL